MERGKTKRMFHNVSGGEFGDREEVWQELQQVLFYFVFLFVSLMGALLQMYRTLTWCGRTCLSTHLINSPVIYLSVTLPVRLSVDVSVLTVCLFEDLMTTTVMIPTVLACLWIDK